MFHPGQDPVEYVGALVGELASAMGKLKLPEPREEGVGPDGWRPAVTPAEALAEYQAQLSEIRMVVKRLDLAARGQIEILLDEMPPETRAKFSAAISGVAGDLRLSTELANLELQMAYATTDRDFPLALRAAEMLIKHDPDHGPAHLTRIGCLLLLQRKPEAIKAEAELQASKAPEMMKLRAAGLIENWGSVDAADGLV